MDFKSFINKKVVLLDGAMGTALQDRGLLTGSCPELLGITNPHDIIAIHKSYVDAGSEVVYTNTFQANSYKLPKGTDVDEIIKAAIANARASGARYVALDIGPSGRLIEPMGDMSFEQAYTLFARQVKAGARYGADLIALETFSSLYEMKAALLAAKENSNLPVLCSMSFEGMRSVNGTTVQAMAITLEGLGADAIGFNCSVGPQEIISAAKELLQYTNLPVTVKVNAGLPNGKTYSPTQFAQYYKQLVDMGVSIIGGCCGTDPRYIKELALIAQSQKPAVRKKYINNCVCSESAVVALDELKIVGERINPTGKKPFKQALISGDYGYAVREAVNQIESFADLLDVNCGLPEIDETVVLPLLVKRIQATVSVPLMLDTSNPVALANALRVYNGVPIVNSVNGDKQSLDAVLPLVKKYGAFVIALTLDGKGIPAKAKQRAEVGNAIINACKQYGIGKERVIIDALTLTVATGEYSTNECLKTLRAFAKRNIKTALGISNISFGLPNRDYINMAFYMQAVGAGLTLAIVNPSAPMISQLSAAARVLGGNLNELNSAAFKQDLLNNNSVAVAVQNTATGGNSVAGAVQNTVTSGNSVAGAVQNTVTSGNSVAGAVQSADKYTLEYCIIKGLKEDCGKIAKELLHKEDTASIIDNHLIKALDEVGCLYESGKIFLPELIASAEAAKAAFEVIRASLNGKTAASKGKIILATVRGDIHDIGKNIVRAVLENYGYTIIDLGRDVHEDAIVQSALNENVALVGLSALMTTTAANMQIAIENLKKAGYTGKVMVGGAVITQEYAIKIGADFYAKNANAATEIAKEVFGA